MLPNTALFFVLYSSSCLSTPPPTLYLYQHFSEPPLNFTKFLVLATAYDYAALPSTLHHEQYFLQHSEYDQPLMFH